MSGNPSCDTNLKNSAKSWTCTSPTATPSSHLLKAIPPLQPFETWTEPCTWAKNSAWKSPEVEPTQIVEEAVTAVLEARIWADEGEEVGWEAVDGIAHRLAGHFLRIQRGEMISEMLGAEFPAVETKADEDLLIGDTVDGMELDDMSDAMDLPRIIIDLPVEIPEEILTVDVRSPRLSLLDHIRMNLADLAGHDPDPRRTVGLVIGVQSLPLDEGVISTIVGDSRHLWLDLIAMAVFLAVLHYPHRIVDVTKSVDDP